MPFFQHSNANLFYTSQGSGPPVLLLHGWACDSHDWSFQIPFLLSRNFTVIALDQRGHGRSSTPDDITSYKLRAFADDAVALLQHLNVGPVILVGHSMGSVIVSIIAAENPEAVKALVLVHPIYGGVPDALPNIGKDMRADPSRAVEFAEDFFLKFMYTPRTPEWLKTWQLRRVLGGNPNMMIGCIEGLVGVFGTVMGQTEEAKKFMQKRKGPRLAVCTLPHAPGWEKEIGLGEGDEVHTITEGTFSHMVEWEKFNSIFETWLRNRGLLED